MTTVCSICHEVVRVDDVPPMLDAAGMELVSHGAHPGCMAAFYGEDFTSLLEGEPT